MEWVELKIIIINIFYACIGSFTALSFMLIGYKLFDYITPFDTHKQLENGNMAIGVVVGAIFISLGVSVGLVVGLGLN